MVAILAWIQRLGFESPLGWDIFSLKNIDTFLYKMNAVAHAQSTFQMLTLQAREVIAMMKHGSLIKKKDNKYRIWTKNVYHPNTTILV